MNQEQEYCRAPLARTINADPDWVWMPTHNTGNGLYDSGFPDGIAVQLGEAASAAERQLLAMLSCQMLCYRKLRDKGLTGVKQIIPIECKAFYGSVPLGVSEEKSVGFHASQRRWVSTVSAENDLHYRLLVWIYPSHIKPARHDLTKASLFLVTPQDWLELEAKTDRKSMSLCPGNEREHAYKTNTIMDHWSHKVVTFDSLLDALKTSTT